MHRQCHHHDANAGDYSAVEWPRILVCPLQNRTAAREFAACPAVAIIGGAPLAHTNGLFQARAVNELNRAANALNQPGGLSFAPQAPAVATRSFGEILQGDAPKVLLIDDVNPVYSSPVAWKVADALKRVPFIVSFGSFIDETSALADLILPVTRSSSRVESCRSDRRKPCHRVRSVYAPLDYTMTPMFCRGSRGLSKPITFLP